MRKSVLMVAAMAAFTVVAGEKSDDVLDVQTNVASARAFTALPLCQRVAGKASVRTPNGEWEDAEEGHFYPLGTSYRTGKGGSLVLAFGPGSTVSISGDAEFGTRLQPFGGDSRTVVLTRGTVALDLPENLPEGAVLVTAPGFTVRNPAGASVVDYADKGDGDEATVLCRTGSLGIGGRHFDIPAMRAADKVRIRTGQDHLFTSLHGLSGNYVVNIDQGVCTRAEVGDDGAVKPVEEKGSLAWHLSPKTQVVINRLVPAIGERMSVHVMTFDASGELRNERAFTEGRAGVNSGELVPQKAGATASNEKAN